MSARTLIEQELTEDVYKLASTQVNLPAAWADYVIKWGREMIPDADLYYDEKGNLGRETESHVTILYGIKDATPSEALLKLVRETPLFTARLMGVTFFDTNPKYDVVKFDVDSEDLVALSNAIRQACPNENKFPNYEPHVTVAYIKKGKCKDIEGTYPFEAEPAIPPEFEVNEVLFKPAGDSGDPKRKVIRIPLNRYTKEAEDPKEFLRRASARYQLSKPTRFGDVSDNTGFAGHDGIKYEKRGGQAYLNGKTLYALGNPDYLCYPLTWPLSAIRAYARHDRRHRTESEDPKQVLRHLHRITRAMPFWQVPEGFYFRTVTYPFLKKEFKRDPDEMGFDTNAVGCDLDTCKRLAVDPLSIVAPPEWGVDDMTSGHKLESLLEAEDPKEFLRQQSHLGFVVADPDGSMWVRFLPSDDVNDTMCCWIHFRSHAYRFASRTEAEKVALHMREHGYPAQVEPWNLTPTSGIEEVRERSPFDFLAFPTYASVLVAKLLELDPAKKPVAL